MAKIPQVSLESSFNPKRSRKDKTKMESDSIEDSGPAPRGSDLIGHSEVTPALMKVLSARFGFPEGMRY